MVRVKESRCYATNKWKSLIMDFPDYRTFMRAVGNGTVTYLMVLYAQHTGALGNHRPMTMQMISHMFGAM